MKPENRDRLYGRRWRKARRLFLSANPLCVMCQDEGRLTASDTVDHIEPHRGDERLFWDESNWQALCETHHNVHKQKFEKRTYQPKRGAVGLDGFPLSQAHPWHPESSEHWGYSIPTGVRRSAIPVQLVCGAPGSGKSTYVRERAQAGDIVIDMDDIRQSLGYRRYDPDPRHLHRTFAARDRIIHGLATSQARCAWLIVMAPTEHERRLWRKALGDVTVHPIDTPAKECRRRIRADPDRAGQVEPLLKAVDRYFSRRSRDGGT